MEVTVPWVESYLGREYIQDFYFFKPKSVLLDQGLDVLFEVVAGS